MNQPHHITRERYEALMKDPLARPKLEIALEIGVFVISDDTPKRVEDFGQIVEKTNV